MLIKKDIKLASLFHFLRSVITKYKLKRPLSGFPAGFHLLGGGELKDFGGGSSLGVGGLRVIKGVGGLRVIKNIVSKNLGGGGVTDFFFGGGESPPKTGLQETLTHLCGNMAPK